MSDPAMLEGIAIVGMAGRFPRSRDLETYWRNLREGVEMVTFFGDQPADPAGKGPRLVRARGILDDIDQFDAAFFGYTPRVAAVMDPQHRLFLEHAWQALEDAGYDCEAYPGAIGVFAGTGRNSYFLSNILSQPEILRELGPHQVATVSDSGFLSTRVSYKLNLRGPSLTVQTTCSTSLVAVHLACQSLLNGECDMALAGGVSIGVPQESGHLYQEGGIFSADGHCRAFDARSTGTVSGSGVGLVVLKRLADALADGDTVRTVIRGSAVNNDGAQKIGYTAPSIAGQAAVISEALNVSGVDPETVTYVEAHGTGTTLGDPIEVAALRQAYGARTGRRQFCALGSVKTNMGHLDEAAGVSGLIKAVLMLEHREIPPSLHFESPNPQIDFANSPFFVNRELRPWETNGTPRRTGVSSFGLGGTNAHLILEEAPAPEPAAPASPWQLLVLSARTEPALEVATGRLADFLQRGDAPALADVAYTLQTGRRPFDHRRFVVCRDRLDAAAVLDAWDAGRVRTGVAGSESRFAAFLFPGQGAQAVGMGRALYETEETFRALVDRCAELLLPELGLDLRRVLYPAPAEAEEAARALDQTRLAQPALFVVEYALASLWKAWGIEPRALLGHSVGEYVAACLAGVFSLEDALSLVAARGRMMQDLPAGAMLAVPLPAARVRELVGEDLSLAAVNAPERCVVAGTEVAVEALRERLSRQGVVAKRLRTSHAFHSALMDPVLSPFAERVRRVALHPPRLPYVSNLTGAWIRPEEATDPGYWARHLRETVLFDAGLELLLAEPDAVLLEVGPGHALTALARRVDVPGTEGRALASLAGGPDDLASILDAAGRLWLSGLALDWKGLQGGASRRRVPLPTYPFERKSHWIERAAAPRELVEAAVPARAEAALSEQSPAAPPVVAAPRTTRKERILARLSEIIGRLFGVKPGELDIHTSFMDLGADSLLLLQANDAIQRELGVKLSFFQLLEECPNLDAVAEHLDSRLPADRFPPEEAMPAPPPAVAAAPAVPASAPLALDLRAVVAQQIELNNHLLRLLAGEGAAPAAPEPPAQALPASAVPQRAEAPRAAAFPFDPAKETGVVRLTPRQQEYLAGFAARYTARTRESKQRSEAHRFHFDDNRNSVGFRLAWKEMVYPIVGERSRGCRIWDVDGNEYVDLTLGFGVNMLGHSPDFILDAVREQLQKGIHVGPQSDLAGEVATLIHEITGMERVTFANSGTEAVMTALRLARAVTGRHKVAFYTGSYHGSFDGTLFNGMYVNGELRAVPRAPGVPPAMGEDLLVLEYGTPASLDILRAHGAELAAILVEPVQSRRPDLQPREYLHELRRLTHEVGAALIFDETITGFRPHPRGAQGVFDLKADLVTYGKVVGGGMPIGVITGIPRFMDAIDGGSWHFGDASVPETAKTFFAGTFCKHPLAMAAARASLLYMKQRGPALQLWLNERTDALATELNQLFAAEEIGAKVVNFGSQFLFLFNDSRFSDLFFFHLIHEGVFVWEGRTCFLSIAHTDEDIRFIVRSVEKSIEGMRRGGFFPERTAAVPVAAVPAVASAAAARAVPLTPAQRQIWIEAQVGADASRAYNETFSVQLNGRFDFAALRAAVQAILDRHEALRATFSPEGDLQWIAPRLEARLEVTDLSAGEDREQRLDAWRRDQESHAFDLVKGPLFRVGLASLDVEAHLLVLTVHHLVVDAWSLGLLLKEVGALYAAGLAGERIELPPPGRFGEYAARTPAEGELEGARRFWLDQFAGEVPVLELPTDFRRPALKTYAGGRAASAASRGLLREVKALAARQRCTPFVVLLAAFELLLHRLTGQGDLVVGVPSAGQPRVGADGLVGFCINMLPLRSRIDGSPSFVSHLARARQTFGQAYENQEYPMGRLLADLKLAPDFSRSPLVAATFNMDWSVVGRSDAPPVPAALHVVPVEPLTHPAKFDLGFDVVDVQGELQIACTFNTDLFRRSTVLRWMAAYEEILRSVCASPEQGVGEVGLVSAAERHQILHEWGTGQPLCVPATTLHHLVEAQVDRSPDAIAVVCGPEVLTYRDLDLRANRLAHRLRSLGVRPDCLVGLCVGRSVAMVVGMLGILKAGGAYVPLDPENPRERLADLLADSGAGWVLTRRGLAEDLPAGRARLVLLDDPGSDAAAVQDRRPAGGAGPENLAYVIYTSGSTGRPKGVQVPHAGVVNRLLWAQSAYPVTAADRILQKASFSFDFSVWESFAPLIAGARLVLAGPGEQRDPAALARTIREREITLVHFIPSMLQVFLAEEDLAGCTSLRYVFSGGEALSLELAERCRARVPAVLRNQYGPTEISIDTTDWTCGPEDSRRGFVPLGRPIANTALRVLDGHLEPAPCGVAGELFVGGVGVTRGYRGRPDLTAERFLPDPFSGAPGARMYRTGDRARFQQDSLLEFLGRTDHQLKVRGFRIEPGEIEGALLSCPGVEQAVVVAREDAPGDRRLVAYLVPRSGASLDTAALRALLKERLPDYMVPGAMVALDELPLTATGKLDRRALPRPDWSRGTASALLRTPMEELIAGLWSEILGATVTDAEISFFEMGGDSLLATRVLSRLRRDLGIELSLRTLFEAPTVRHLARRIESERGTGGLRELPPLRRVPRDSAPPLSFAQQRLWFIDRLQPDTPLYNIPAAIRLQGNLDVRALAGSFAEIVRRHEVLRTRFAEVEGRPVQRIGAPSHELSVVDLRGLAAGPREAEMNRLAAAESQRPFDLAAGPLLRTTLLLLTPEEQVALVVLHHIVGDGWSLEILLRECGHLYNALTAGAPVALPELPVQYADFAVWQREWMRGETLEAELSWWRGYLAGAPPVLELPLDHPRPAVQDTRGAMRSRLLPADLWDRLKTSARRLSASPFMLLTAAFEALLYRHTGQSDFCLGTPVSGRHRVEVESLIGLFVNTLTLRASPRGETSFERLVAGVRNCVLEAHLHQDLPFERLVEELAPERRLAQTPLFQVAFQHDGPGRGGAGFAGLTLSFHPVEVRTAKFALQLSTAEQGGGLVCGLVYGTALFESATIERLLDHWQVFLAGLAGDPGRCIDELPLLCPSERRQIVEEWNATSRPYPADACVQDLFAEEARLRPESLAATCGEEGITYRELDRRSNQLARRLRELSVGPEVRVGLAVARSFDLLVGVLGILKAGGAYVPLDPSYPLERLAFMVEDAGLSVLVGQEEACRRLPGGFDAVLLDAERGALDLYDDTPIAARICSSNLAYVIYTSGSTGRPKGVEVSHRGVVRLVRGADYVRFGPGEVLLQLAPVSFDASTFEIWGALLNGGRVALPPPGLLSLDEIGREIERHGVTTLFMTTGLFNQFVDNRLDALRSVRQLLTGGEALSLSHMRRAVAGLPDTVVINCYGPTENTTFTSCHPVTLADLAAVSAPLGEPIANTRIYLVDSALQPVPVGVRGELSVAGEGVARGYLGRPDLTADRFVPDPFSPGGRLYRTGDFARRLPGGQIEFMGRTDRQVKVRGFRIEPGEIEAALQQHPGVRQAVMVLRGDAPNDRKLVAYVVPDPQAPATAGDLRSFLADRLPEHMMPQAFVSLPELPLTPNGKLDSARLPEPAGPADEAPQPVTEIEALLAELWAQVFRREGVGRDDDFFELGGHSLLAVEMVARIRQLFGVDLPLQKLFEKPLLGEMAGEIESLLKQGEGLTVPPVVPVPRDRAVPLSFGQQRLWFLDRLQPGATMYNLPCHIRLNGELDGSALERSLNEVLRRHDTLRTSFRATGGQPFQVVSPFQPSRLPVVDLEGLQEERREGEAKLLAREHTAQPFELGRGPLLSVGLVRLGPASHLLLLTLHHAICDGRSMEILTGELSAIYLAFTAGKPSPLAALPVQYADFAHWQRTWLQGEVLESQIAYWRRHLSGSPPLLKLPTDRARPPVQTFRGSRIEEPIPTAVTASLRRLCREEQVTPFMALFAAYLAVLHRHSQETDLLVGAPVAYRHLPEIENLIGFFANTLVFRADLAGDPSFRSLLGRVRRVVLEAYAHQDVTFDKIVEELQPVRDPSYSPIFQVGFSFLQQSRKDVPPAHLTLSALEPESSTAQFELNLTVLDNGTQFLTSWSYNTDLFDARRIQHLAGDFRRVLEAATEDPDLALTALNDLLAEAYRLEAAAKETEQKQRRSQTLGQIRRKAVVTRS